MSQPQGTTGDSVGYRPLQGMLPMGTQQPDSNFSMWLSWGADIIAELKHYLKGEEQNVTTGSWERNRRPLMNDLGIAEFSTYVATVFNRNTWASYLTEKDVMMALRDFNIDIIFKIGHNYERWELAKDDMSLLVDVYFYTLKMAFQRALLGGERNLYKTVVVERHLLTQQEQEKKNAGVLSKLFRLGGGN